MGTTTIFQDLSARLSDVARSVEQLRQRLLRQEAGEQEAVEMLRQAEAMVELARHLSLKTELSHFRMLIEQTSDWVWEVDADGRYTYCNPKVKDLLGYEVEEMLGKRAFDCMPEGEGARVAAAYQDIVRRAEPFSSLEHVNLHKDGHLVVLETSGVPVRDENGRLTGYRGIDRDVTKRKAVECELRESQERFRELTENIREVFWIVSPDWNSVIYVSVAYEQIWGRSCRSLYENPRAWVEAVVEEDREEVLAEILRKQLDGFVSATWPEYRIARPDGSIRWIATRSFPVRDRSGQVYRVAGVAEDITERKLAADALAQREATLHGLLRAAPIGIGVVKDLRFQWINEQFCTMTGYTAEELLGQCARMVHDSDEEFDRVGIVKHEEVARLGIASVETRFKRKDGQMIDILLRAAALDPTHPEAGLIFTTTDITQRRRMEEDLRRSAESLTRSNEELEQFAYIASHDLQEPLRMVKMYLDLLSRRYQGRLDADADTFIAYAADGAVRMERLINDLLALSRVSTRGQPFVAVDLGLVLDRALDNLTVSMREAGATVTHGALPTVLGDEMQLAQLLQNLVGNAIKYRSMERECRVDVQARRDGEQWVVTVADNGIGIDPEFHSRIFQVFQRLHTVKDYPGTGVGLAICKKIVERHGGRIWVESRPGEGAAFNFTLPAAD